MPLSEPARKKLIKIIVEWTARNLVWLSVNDFPKLFEKIVSIFPNEHISSYYVAKSKANKSPSGHLYNAFKKRHEQVKKENNLRRNQKPKKQEEPLTPLLLPEKIDVIRQRLIHRSEPWTAVLDDWKYTFELRRMEVTNIKGMKLAEFLKRWPKFQHKRGTELVRTFRYLS